MRIPKSSVVSQVKVTQLYLFVQLFSLAPLEKELNPPNLLFPCLMIGVVSTTVGQIANIFSWRSHFLDNLYLPSLLHHKDFAKSAPTYIYWDVIYLNFEQRESVQITTQKSFEYSRRWNQGWIETSFGFSITKFHTWFLFNISWKWSFHMIVHVFWIRHPVKSISVTFV